MALKPVYVIEGRRWLPLGRAAALAGTSTARLKVLMGDGRLDWRQLRPNSTTLLVGEATIRELRTAHGQGRREVARRAEAATRTAMTRGVAQSVLGPLPPATGRLGPFDRTWDPSALPLPISGRQTEDHDE